MLYQLNITMTEEDYIAYNEFHSLESKEGKKQLRKGRILYLLFTAALMVLFLLVVGRSSLTPIYVALMALYTAVYMAMYKKVVKKNIRKQITVMKKSGKLPFDPQATFEFYGDRLVEITPDKRIEQRYDGIQRVCVLPDRYILLYHTTVGAYILPIPQIGSQVNQADFLRFLSEKCPTMETY